ncbi:unnamed protein product [Ectocarpus sp. 13 AM-2016]
MVKSSGGRWKGSGSGSAPSSPTRRLKKGGKRGRRLCHMEGCTLCPSFGFEGDVAVSCSHHKEDGMRNLTARRCQHNGCFTVANFGFPGDKPGYCAAHSTEGMVNRNKPRGSEGMLSGMTVSRSSRRAAKASIASSYATGGSESAAAAGAPKAAAAGAAAAAATTEGSGGLVRNQASSGGKELLTRTAMSGDVMLGRHGAFGNGAETHAAIAPAVASRARASGSRRRGSYRDSANSDGDEKAELGKSFFGGGNHSNATGGGKFKSAEAQAQEAAAAPVPPPPVAFIARGDGVEAANARSHPARAGGGGGGGGRPRGDSKGLGSATITAGVLQHQEAFVPVSRGGGMLPVVETAGGGGRMAVDVSFRGDTRMDGSFLMDGGSFEETSVGAGGASLGAGVDTGRAELRSILLGDAGDTPEVRDSVADGGLSFAGPSSSPRVARPAPGVQSLHEASRTAGGQGFGRDFAASGGGEHAGARSSFESGGSLASGGGTAPARASAAGVFTDFGLDHLPELSSNDFAGLRGGETGVGANHLPRVTLQQHQQRTASRGPYDLAGEAAAAAAAGFFSSGEGVRLGSDSSASAAAAVLAASSVVSDDVPSEAFSSSDASSVSFAAGPHRAATAAAESRPPPSNGGDAIMAPAAATRMMMPGEEAWWEVLEGEEFVAMPEPTWGGVGGLDTQSMMEESLRANPRGCGWRSDGGGGGVSGGGGRGGFEANRGMAESGRSPHGDGGRTVTSHAAATRSLSLDSYSVAAATAAAGFGGVLVMPGDEGFSGDMSGRDSCGRNGVVHGISGGSGSGGRLCPSSKKFAASVGDARVAFPTSPFMPGAPPAASRTMRPSSRELGSASTTSTSPSGSVFSPAASSSPNGVYPIGFGLAVHSQVPLPHGGAGLRSAGQGSAHENSGSSKAWVPGDMWATTATTTTSGDAMSPSKCLSLSPAKAVTALATSPSSSS